MKKLKSLFLIAVVMLCSGCNSSNSKSSKISNEYEGKNSLYTYVLETIKTDLNKVNSPQKMLQQCKIDKGLQDEPKVCFDSIGIGAAHPKEIGATLSTIKNIKVIGDYYHYDKHSSEVIIQYEKNEKNLFSRTYVPYTIIEDEKGNLKINMVFNEDSVIYIIYLFASEWTIRVGSELQPSI